MQERGLTKAAMAHEMHTSRAALDRLLDPENTSVTLIHYYSLGCLVLLAYLLSGRSLVRLSLSGIHF